MLQYLLIRSAHAYALSKEIRVSPRRRTPYTTVDSALQKLEDAEFIEGRRESNERNVIRVVYSLKPHVKELLEVVRHDWAMEILHTALVEHVRHPKAEPAALLAAAIKSSEAANNVTFPTPKDGYIDGLFKYIQIRANPHPPKTGLAKSNYRKVYSLEWEKVLGSGPFFRLNESGKPTEMSVQELAERLKLSASTVVLKGQPLFATSAKSNNQSKSGAEERDD